jgi:hypothetical protein
MSPASWRAALPAAGWEHGDPEPGQQDRPPHRAVAGQQSRDAQPEPGQPDPGPGHLARVPPVGDDPEERLQHALVLLADQTPVTTTALAI